MPLNNSTFAEGTTIGYTGGTTKTLVSIGGSTNHNELYVDEDTSSVTRRRVLVDTTAAKVSPTAPGGYTQERIKVALHQPKILANGNKTVNKAEFTLAVDPESTDAERTALAEELLQIAQKASDLLTKGNPQ